MLKPRPNLFIHMWEKDNILELDHKCQNTTRSGSFIDMLEHTKRSMKALYKAKKQILCSQHILANYFENEALKDIVVIIDLILAETI